MLHNSLLDLLFAQHVSGTIMPIIRSRRHNLQPHTTPTTNHNQSYVPHAVNTCLVSSSWW